MKRSWIKRKSGFKNTGNTLRRTPLRRVGRNPTAVMKEKIQALVREIVMKRDKGCILRQARKCGGEIGEVVIQADHLIPRNNSATFADTRLIVCLCRSCHGWKHWHKEEYDALVKTILPKERVELWDKCQADSWRATRTGVNDWAIMLVVLKKELSTY